MKLIASLFCQHALSSAEGLSSAERADFLDFAGSVLMHADCPIQAEAAKTAAADLRNADAAQARFEALLSAAIDTNIVPRT